MLQKRIQFNLFEISRLRKSIRTEAKLVDTRAKGKENVGVCMVLIYGVMMKIF
jgi:hypothetical protein